MEARRPNKLTDADTNMLFEWLLGESDVRMRRYIGSGMRGEFYFISQPYRDYLKGRTEVGTS